jgi:hypothetical protein
MPTGYILPHKLHMHILTPQKHGFLGTTTFGQLIQVSAHVLQYDIYPGRMLATRRLKEPERLAFSAKLDKSRRLEHPFIIDRDITMHYKLGGV